MAHTKNMIYYKTNAEIELIRESCRLVEGALAEVAKMIKPGVTTMQMDAVAEKYIRDEGGVPSFKGYKGFPFTACISVNDAVVHGFPNNEPVKDGDIVSVDVGAFKNGFHGDSAYTFGVGNISAESLQLMKVTKESLYKGIEKAIVNNRVGDISFAVQDYCENKHGYGIVRDLVGHGLGKSLHEDPQVPNFGRRGNGPKLQQGLVIAIEPMVNMGTRDVYVNEKDQWTIHTADGKPAAHYEHTICVMKGKPEILSSFAKIEKAEKENDALVSGY
jgi:methionyl aminopeptidase